MATFTYEAVDRTGRKTRSEIEAVSTQEATDKLRKMGYFPTNIKEKPGSANPNAAAPGVTEAGAIPKKKRGINLLIFGGVSQKLLSQFTHQLSILQDAGLPLLRSLKILAHQLKPCLLKSIIEEVSNDVEAGTPLSEAMAKHPKAFNKLYVNMVKAGEAGGVLDTILRRLAMFLEKAQALKRKVIGALTYPAVVVVVAVLILTVIMIKVVPEFEKIFQEMKGEGLPAMTQILLDFSNIIVHWWPLIPAVPIGIFLLIKIVGQKQRGRLLIDRIKLNVPVVGMIMRKAAITRFCRTFGTLLASGVPILEALTIIRHAIGNEVIATAIEKVHDSIREGESIAAPLAQSRIFDEMVINMIEVGEETGELDKMLMKIADTYEEEVDALVGSLTSILEPVMILFLGIAVGFIVIALFMPMIDLMKGFG